MIAKSLLRNMALAAITLVGAEQLKLAARFHLLGADSAARAAQMLIGLTLAVFANYIPKSPSASLQSPARSDRARSTLRPAGWAFTVAGVAYAATWAVTPLDVAFPLGITIVASAIVVTLVYCVWACSRRPSKSAPAS